MKWRIKQERDCYHQQSTSCCLKATHTEETIVQYLALIYINTLYKGYKNPFKIKNRILNVKSQKFFTHNFRKGFFVSLKNEK